MELRCHNCGQRLKLEGVTLANQEVVCAACGAAMIVPPPPKAIHRPTSEYSSFRRWRHRLLHGERRKSEPKGMSRVMKRVYDPLPSWTLYVAGIGLALGLLSPFWVYLLQGRFQGPFIQLSQDTTNLTVTATNTTTAPLPPPPPLLTDIPAPPEPSLKQFNDLHLNDNRDDVVQRFNLQLQNTRGMEPEVYEGGKTEKWEQLKAFFYGSLLKEFSMVCLERRLNAESQEKELIEQCGDPLQRTDTENLTNPVRTLGLPGLKVSGNKNEIGHRLAAFRYRRDLIWTDSTNRVDATIYYSSKDPALCTSMLTIYVSAANWLKSHQPQIGVTPPPAQEPVVPEAPKRFFP